MSHRLDGSMRNDTGGKKLLEQSYYALIVVLFLITGVLAFFFVRADIRQEQSHLLRGLETSLRDLLVHHLLESDEPPGNLYVRVQGFGIYDSAGEKIFSYRDTPESVSIGEFEEVDWDIANRKLVYMERTDVLLRNNRDWIENPLFDRILLLSAADTYQILYMSCEIPSELMGKIILQIILVAVCLVSLGGGVLFLRLAYSRYRKIQEELRSSEHLIILGTAARTLTHEMKNPLSIIRLQTSILHRTVEAGTDELTIIEEEVHRLSALMDQTRSFLDDPLGLPETVDLKPFMENLKNRYPEEISWLLPEHSTVIRIDSDRLRSILDNLLSNAIESGSPIAGIAIELTSGAGNCMLSVKDSGDGIPPEIMGRITEPFFTTKTRGTGLGLHLASCFTEAAGGSLEILSLQGSGTEIVIALPEAKQ